MDTSTMTAAATLRTLSVVAALFIGSLTIGHAVTRAADPGNADATAATAEQIQFFETKIRPLLAEHCYECHGADTQESELRVDTLVGMLQGGHAGASISPGKPDRSLLVTAISYRDSELEMPPSEKLSDSQIADVRRWVEMGVPHPDSDKMGNARPVGDVDLEEGRQHWAFRSPVKPIPPRVLASSPALPEGACGNAAASNPIDAFLIAGLETKGLRRAAPADKATLIRRATFDLTGLPPTPAEVHSFLADDSDQAYSRLIDRLLASPHYGERWGRHWLDIARYADSNGLDENVAYGNAWRYRDYVVKSLNQDKPYDEFVVEQLAGDLLESNDDIDLRNERLIATGFLVLGPKFLAEQDEAKMEMDIIDEQIDTLGRGMMGLTLGCARCHTHKFDPISHHDYYALAGIFKSTRTMDHYRTVAKWHENPVGTREQIALWDDHDAKIAAIKQSIEDCRLAAAAELDIAPDELSQESETQFPEETTARLTKLRAEVKELEAKPPAGPTAMGVVEGEIADASIHLRGSHLTLGDSVPRRFPEVLTDQQQPNVPEGHSGRLEFANWLTSGTHPLTARVMVNRIWHGHFGKGIVKSVDNFGLRGDRPSHPELLDWLAVRFVEENWSIKAMHRMIMLSDAYQAASDADPQNARIDPDNQYYWRFDLRRLEAEAIRDGLLALAGKLDPEVGGNLMGYDNREYVFNHTSEDKSTYDTMRRSIYVPVIRNHLYDMFQLFDYADASVLTGDRSTSTIASQALFMMNSPLVEQLSLSMAERLLETNDDVDDRVEQLYMGAYGRPPSTEERARAVQFAAQYQEVLVQSGDVTDRDLRVWQALCQSVVSSSEFFYLR